MITFKQLREAAAKKDDHEYGYEGEMVMSQLKSMMRNAKELLSMIEPNTDFPEWVQAKITLAQDYIQTAADYMATEMSEETIAEKRGLWDNIHAKQERIKNGSKEHMRKPGSKGAPTKQDFVNSQTEEVAAWQRKEGKNPEGGLNKAGVDSYRREHPGSHLQTAVTTKPSKLKKGSKAANRRKSFCARMSGMKKRLTSSKTANDPNSRINKSLRKWNC